MQLRQAVGAKKRKKNEKGAVAYARRAIEDQYVDEQLRKAIARLGEVYRSVSRQKASAAEDKKLYRNLREAATSIRNVVTRVEQPPPPPKRTGRTALLVGLSGATAVVIVKRARRRRTDLPLEPDPGHDGRSPGVEGSSEQQTGARSAA